jgi:hypothetical protein
VWQSFGHGEEELPVGMEATSTGGAHSVHFAGLEVGRWWRDYGNGWRLRSMSRRPSEQGVDMAMAEDRSS